MRRSGLKYQKIALIGYGYWGKKIYHSLKNIVSKELIYVIDPTVPKDTQLQTDVFDSVLNNADFCHILIATPEETHFELAKACLENKKNIFVEKPLCLSIKEARILEKLSKKNKVQLYVNYIFLFDPYVVKIKHLLDNGIIGSLFHIESIRHSTNIYKPNVTVFDDLATHDMYLGKYFCDAHCSKTKVLKESIGGKQVNQGTVHYQFQKKTLTAHYSWIQPVATRTMTFIGSEGTLVWDKTKKDILLYKHQQLCKEITVKSKSSALETSLKYFLNHDTRNNSINSYLSDVKILEEITTR